MLAKNLKCCLEYHGVNLGLTLTVAFLLALPGAAHAQTRDPSGFFDQGYMNAPGNGAGGGASKGGSAPAAGNAAKPAPAAPAEDLQGDFAFEEPSGDELAEVAPANVGAGLPSRTSGVADFEKGLPVLWVNAIINALNREHLEKSYEELAAAVKSKKVKVGSIYLIGTPFQYSDRDKEDFQQRYGLRLENFRETIPDAYASSVSRSPTWIVQTENDGQFVLEAIGPLADYFNKKGEFVDVSGAK